MCALIMLRSLVRFQLAPQKPWREAISTTERRPVSAASILLQTELLSGGDSVELVFVQVSGLSAWRPATPGLVWPARRTEMGFLVGHAWVTP